jgi:hypothetical protein
VVKKLFGKLTGKGAKPDERTDAQKKADLDKAVIEANKALGEEGRRRPAERKLKEIAKKYRLTRADIVVDETKRGTTFFHAELEINPIAKSNKAGEMDFIDPPLKVAPAFFCKKSLDKAEFARQVKLQQDAINAMDVHTWLANRQRFVREGRSAEGTKAQRKLMDDAFAKFRARVVTERRGVYRKAPYNDSLPQAQAKAEAFANRLLAYTEKNGRRVFKNTQWTDREHDGKTIENELHGQAALHRLDQVAGGGGTDLAGLGGEREDFSLGAQWNGGRINNLEKGVKKEVKGKKAAELKNIRMSVEMPVVYE